MGWKSLVLIVLTASVPARAVTTAPVIVKVTIDQVAFKQASVSAHVGDTIEWTNRDVIDHTATAKNGDFDGAIPAGKSACVVLKKAGEVEYDCQYHPNMVAKVVVTAR